MPLTAQLHPHPDTPCPDLAAVTVTLAGRPDGGLDLGYTLSGTVAGLLIPDPAAPGHADGLWRHTCCECFLMADAGPGYREFNFAPSGQWAAYAFADYRTGAGDLAMPAPTIVFRNAGDRLQLRASLPAAALPEGGRLRLALSAVIETVDGRLSYWALRHPPGRPDFHHTHGFALDLSDHEIRP